MFLWIRMPVAVRIPKAAVWLIRPSIVSTRIVAAAARIRSIGGRAGRRLLRRRVVGWIIVEFAHVPHAIGVIEWHDGVGAQRMGREVETRRDAGIRGLRHDSKPDERGGG